MGLGFVKAPVVHSVAGLGPMAAVLSCHGGSMWWLGRVLLAAGAFWEADTGQRRGVGVKQLLVFGSYILEGIRV